MVMMVICRTFISHYGTLKWTHRSNQSVLGIQNIWETTENWENEAFSSGLVTRRLYFLKNKRTLNGHFSRPAQTDPYGDFSLSLESSEIRPVPAKNQVKRKNKSPSQRTRDSRRRTNLLKKEYAPNTSPSASLTDLEIPPLITQGLPVSVSRDSLGYQQN